MLVKLTISFGLILALLFNTSAFACAGHMLPENGQTPIELVQQKCSESKNKNSFDDRVAGDLGEFHCDSSSQIIAIINPIWTHSTFIQSEHYFERSNFQSKLGNIEKRPPKA